MGEFVYLNGRIIPEERASVPVADRGLLYGDGLFETIRTTDGAPEHLGEHLERLAAGARSLGFPAYVARETASALKGGLIERLVKKNGLDRGIAAVRVTITAGPVPVGYARGPRGLEPTVLVMTRPVDEREVSRIHGRGLGAVIVEGLGPAVPGIKTIDYISSVLGKSMARKRGAYEAIFTGPGGAISEGTSSNVFIVKRGRVSTPPLIGPKNGMTILPGVMRTVVIEAAGRLGISVSEKRIRSEDLASSDEAFLTNSVLHVAPLVRLDSRKIGPGRPGPVTRSLMDEVGP